MLRRVAPRRDRRTASFLLLATAALAGALTLAATGGAAPSKTLAPTGTSRLALTTVTPTNGSTVSGSITWQVNVTGGVPSRVDFAIDGTVKWSESISPYLYNGTTGGVDTTTLADGTHTLSATAYPTGKGRPAKSSVSVTVSNKVATPPAWSLPPAITGVSQVGQTLSSSTGSWSGTLPIGYAFQWLRCDSGGGNCAAVAGATAQSYGVGSADLGSTLRSRVTASNSAGLVSVQSAQTAMVLSGSVSGSGSVYWGASIEGATYSYSYGGSYGNPPWDDNTWNLFESHAGKKVSILSWSNVAPWGHDFNYYLSMQEKVRARGDLSLISMNSGSVPLRDITNGQYDSSIRTWAQQAKAWGHPFFLRWDWEMNGNWFSWSPGVNGNTAADYINSWRHIYTLFSQAGASNVTWVWCPNIDPAGIYAPYSQVYPGNAYVDWTCLDGYNKGSIYTPPGWRSFSTIFASSYNSLLQLAPTKPILIAETSSEEAGGSKAAWITDMLGTQLPQYFPKIKAFVWYNTRQDQAGHWWPWEIESSSAAQTAFATGIASNYYAAGGNYGNLPPLSPIQPPA
jgi:Glycosyl hydrolase family 26/Bacterial Ig domain